MITSVLSGHSSPLRCVALSRDNSYVVSGGEDGTIIVYSTKTGIVEYRADNVFAVGVRGLCYLPNGSLLACGSGGGLKVFSPSLELHQILVGHNGTVRCVTVSPSGSHLASGEANCPNITRVILKHLHSRPLATLPRLRPNHHLPKTITRSLVGA